MDGDLVFPLAPMGDEFRRGEYCRYGAVGSIVCFHVCGSQFSALRSAWTIVVSKQHPAMQMASEPVIEASDEAV